MNVIVSLVIVLISLLSNYFSKEKSIRLFSMLLLVAYLLYGLITWTSKYDSTQTGVTFLPHFLINNLYPVLIIILGLLIGFFLMFKNK